MDKKKSLIIGVSVGGALLLALIVVSVVLANRPSALIARATANTLADAERFEAVRVAEDVANGGSVAISANLDKYAKDDLVIQAKYYSDAQKLKGAFEMSMLEDDDVVLRPRLLYNQDSIAFSCPEILDEVYGINIKHLEKNLEGSIFDPDEETDYSLTEEQFDYFLNLKNTLKKDSSLQHDIEKVSSRYTRLATEKLIKYSDVKRSGKTITVGGEKIPCTLITISVDEDSIALIAEDLIDYADDDEELEDLLYRFASNASVYDDPDEMVDEFYDNLDEIEDKLDDLEDIEITLEFYITKSGRRLAQLDGEIEIDDEGCDFSLVIGRNITKSKEISFTYEEKGSKEGYALTYSVKENSSRLYEAEIKIEESSVRRNYYDYDWDYGWDDWSDPGYDEELETETTTIKIEWDKKDGDLTIKYKGDWYDYVIKGNLLKKGDKYTFVLTNIKSDGTPVSSVKSLGLTVTIDRHDPAPNVPGRYTDITKMSERDFKHFTKDLEEGFEDIWKEYFR